MRPVTRYNPETGEVTRTKVAPHSPCGKRLFSSMKLAKAEAKRQSRLSGEDIEAYHCYPCHGAHLGHRPPPFDRDVALGMKPTPRELRQAS